MSNADKNENVLAQLFLLAGTVAGGGLNGRTFAHEFQGAAAHRDVRTRGSQGVFVVAGGGSARYFAPPVPPDAANVRHLLRQGADIRTSGQHGATVLMFAACAGDLSLMKAALKGGVDVNARTDSGWTALMNVMCLRNEEKLRLLLDFGADVNAKDDGGRTALMLAVSFKFRNGINIMVARGADSHAKNSKGYSAPAYTDGHPGITRLLREQGATD
jgi:hypothetical protein